MQSSGEQPLVGEEHCVTTLITAAKETRQTHEIYNLCDIDATSESRKFEKVDLSLFNR